jgi:putative ABC transport system permease protein
MRFVIRMAVRELRASWRRLLLFFVCIALGVGGIVLLRSVVQDVRAAIARDARSMVAADVTLSTSRPWDEKTRQIVERRLAGVQVLARAEGVETNTMVRPADERRSVTRMAEVRGVQPAFPLYGTVELQDGRPYAHALLAGHGALVRPELLVQLESRIGDDILIGTGRFTVRGVIVAEPGRRVSGFSFAPRILVDAADLETSGLLGFGSRVSRDIQLRLPERSIEPVAAQLRADLRGLFVNVRSFRGTEDRIGDDLSRAENYLSLVGLVIVILGGIGVSSVMRVFVRQKVRSVAILKCLGATSRQVFAAYLAQAVLLGGAGCLLGVALAAAGLAALPLLFAGQPGMASVPNDMTPSAVLQGVAIGLLVAVLFSAVPLLDVRRVKPSLLLRESERAGGRDWVGWAALAGLLAALVLIASWQAGSIRIGLAVSAGLAAVTLVLSLVGAAFVRAIRPLASSRSVALRHAVLRLTRPGNQTRAVLLSVGLGAFFIVGVRSLQANLLDQFSVTLDGNAADMFLIDVQPAQTAAVARALTTLTGTAPPPAIPVLRARVTSVAGREVTLRTYEEVRGRGGLGREFTVTWRDRLQPNEKVIEGRFWGPEPAAADAAEVSIEQGLRDRSRLQVGDVVRFDILGRVVSARITSVRAVEWRDARQGGFMFVFRPGPLDKAPATFVAPARGPADPAARARVQRSLVDAFPNVSVVDLREILQIVERVIANVTLAVSVVGGLVLLVGGLILVGSVSMTRFQRIYEVAIFRTLGAGTRLLTMMTALEYGVLGLIAGAIGSTAAIALTYVVSRHALDIPWSPRLAISLIGIAVTSVVVCVVGLAASADILRRRPLGSLRSE